MKKNKLSLEKFRIARLDNPKSILGGDGDDGTKGRPPRPKCIKTSLVVVNDAG